MSLKHAIKSVVTLWFGSLLGAGAAFFCQVLLARQLGPADFGMFAASLATVVLVTPLAGFGIAQFWLKAFGQEGRGAVRWLPGSFRFTTSSTLTTMAALFAWALLGPNDDSSRNLLLMLVWCVPGQMVVELVSGMLQLEARYTALTYWQLATHFTRLTLICAAYLALGGPVLQQSAAIYALVSLTLCLFGIRQLRRMGGEQLVVHGHVEQSQPLADTIPTTGEVIANAWPFGLAGLFYLIYFQSDIILIKHMVGEKSAGFYNVAFTVMTAVYLFPGVIYQKFLLPKIHRWAHHDKKMFYRVYWQGNIGMTLLGLVAMVAIWLTMPWIIPILFGPSYDESIGFLKILAFAAPIRFLATSIGATLVTQENMKRKIKYMGSAAIANVMLNLISIPTFGAEAAAVVTVFCEILILFLYYFSAKKNVFFDAINI